MDYEYRISSTVKRGYFVIVSSVLHAKERIDAACELGSNDAIGRNAKLQRRKIGTVGNDSTWEDMK